MADQLVKLLNRYGYQPVFLPRTGLLPPELYNYVKPELRRRGPLADYMPEVNGLATTTGRLADIEGKYTSSKNPKATVDFLKSALAVLGISGVPKINLAFVGADELTFAFADVTYRAIDPSKLDSILQKLTIPASIPDEYVNEGDLYIVFEYAYSPTLRMSRADQKSFSVDVSGKIADFIDVGAGTEIDVHGNHTVSFSKTAAEPAGFAFKAGRLQRITGKRWIFEPDVVCRSRGEDQSMAAVPPHVPARGVVLTAIDAPGTRCATGA